jgi:hypothetical protein
MISTAKPSMMTSLVDFGDEYGVLAKQQMVLSDLLTYIMLVNT